MIASQKTAFQGSETTMRVHQVAQELQISLIKAYELTRREDFPSFKIGKRIIIPREGFLKWIDQQTLGS